VDSPAYSRIGRNAPGGSHDLLAGELINVITMKFIHISNFMIREYLYIYIYKPLAQKVRTFLYLSSSDIMFGNVHDLLLLTTNYT